MRRVGEHVRDDERAHDPPTVARARASLTDPME
jgi:hypothetical protein